MFWEIYSYIFIYIYPKGPMKCLHSVSSNNKSDYYLLTRHLPCSRCGMPGFPLFLNTLQGTMVVHSILPHRLHHMEKVAILCNPPLFHFPPHSGQCNMPFFPTCRIALQGQNGMDFHSIPFYPFPVHISPVRYFSTQNMHPFVFLMGKYFAFYVILITELVTVPKVVVIIVVIQITCNCNCSHIF